VKEKVEKE